MTATIAAPAGAAHRVPVTRCYRFELVKLLSQWRVRLLILAAWVAPAVFVGVVSQQSSLPTDTVFGRWMHATGWAGSLVMLGFSEHVGAAVAHLGGGRRCVRRRGPARHVAPPAGGGPLTAADLPGQGIGQPHRDPVAGDGVGLLQRGRRDRRRG